MRRSATVWIWQHDKRTDDYKIIFNCVRKLMKNKSEKEAGKGPSFFYYKKTRNIKIIAYEIVLPENFEL